MLRRRVAVLGAGVAGLSAAILLARDGHRVTLVERDDLVGGDALSAPGWRRSGIPHFLQPHAFIPRGVVELRRLLPDVYDRLLASGADEVDASRKIPGGARPGDGDLRYLAVRRPVIEWALRRAARDTPGIDVVAPARAQGLALDDSRVTGVRVDEGVIEVDVVVDALGRRSPVAGWLPDGDSEPTHASDCFVVYYSRYYRVRPGATIPDGPWFLSPRGDLGFMAYASFPGDNGTFAGLLAVPTHVPEWKSLRDEAAFEAAVALTPLSVWADPAAATPITDVLPMAGLRNTLSPRAGSARAGVFAVGDAYGHSDPVLAHGLAFALVHADMVATALRDHRDVADAHAAYVASTHPELAERYVLSTALDEQRHRMWTGGPVDVMRHDGDYALFTMAAGGAAATVDGDLARVFLRRIGLLDSTSVLDGDVSTQLRIESVFHDLMASRGRPPGPTRDEMLAAVSAATASVS